MQNKYWFKRKRIGYGWTPASLEGWLLTFLYIGVIVWRANTFGFAGRTSDEVLYYVVLPIIILTAVFIFICYKTGEPLR